MIVLRKIFAGKYDDETTEWITAQEAQLSQRDRFMSLNISLSHSRSRNGTLEYRRV